MNNTAKELVERADAWMQAEYNTSSHNLHEAANIMLLMRDYINSLPTEVSDE
jgi:hypothetical protein